MLSTVYPHVVDNVLSYNKIRFEGRKMKKAGKLLDFTGFSEYN